ncbi:hypothetical protein [Nocardioides insulae]|uniref:hypothetical protein n=1 Tax=Nocardioides insulae TaxID=394734 RepID=UPI00041F3FEE|nr:hypothetical protein [Nocardioides insulae]
MPPQLPTPSRRSLLGAASSLPLAALAGCSLEDLRAPETTPSAITTSAPPPDADEALVTSASDRILTARRTAAAAAATPGATAAVSTAATTLVTLHDTHLAALTPEGETSPTPSPSATTPGTVSLARLRRSETSLQADLAEDAVSAANAELAQLLASMSAAVAQQVSLLPSGSGR